jgi:hypothetical protein
MSCTICQHPKRQEIDQALIAGSTTLAALSQEHGLSTSALHRHKTHLQANVNRAQDQLQNNLRQGCIFWLSQALEMAMATAKAAQTEGNFKVVLQALGHGTRIINLILKQDFQLSPEVLYEILASPQWTAQTGLLPDDPNIMAMSRQSLAGTLSSPCPETAAPASSPASPVDLDLMQQVLQGLTSPPADQPKTGNRKLETENRLFKKRDKSGKLPGKSSASKDNNKYYQKVKLYENIAGSLDLLQPAQFAALGTQNSELETLFPGKLPENKPLSEYIYERSLKDSQCAKNNGKGASAHPPVA